MTNVQAETLNGGESGSWIRRVLGATVAPRTWLATFYLLLTLPLGILWFTLIVTGVALGLGLVVIWVGVPLLVVTIVVWVHAARLERWLIRTCLGVDIPDPSRRLIGGSAFRRLRAIVTDPATWKDFVYLILLLPLGIAWFTIVVTAWSAALGLLTVPAYYWAISGGLQIADTGTRQISIDTWPEALAAAAVGLVLTLLAPLVIRACAAIHAWIACGLLGRSGKAALSARVADLTQTRSRAVDAAEAERRRIERDLHDGAQARLVALAMDLGRAREHLDDNPTAAAELVAQAHEEAKRTLVELRGLARGIHPAILTDRGLDAALSSLAARAPFPVDVEVALPGDRPPARIESIAYFVVAEALTNAAKHASASHGWVTLARSRDQLLVEVGDDGAGGAELQAGGGLAGLADRVAAVDGRLTLSSPPGGPTVVRAELPCES